MGISATASIVLGVKIQEKTVDRTVTRYNPKTGEPYQTTEREETFFLLSNDQEILFSSDEEHDDMIDAYEEGDFGIINADGEYSRGFSALGLVVARQSGYSDDRFTPVVQPTIEQLSLAREKLAGMGITEEPKPLLVLGLSC